MPPVAWLGGLAAPFTPFASSRARETTLALERFVYDARFTEAFEVGEHVGALGVPLSPVADDLMQLWYDELDLLWKDEPRALAGVTMAEALFVLETLALDRQMRVVWRGHHGLVEDGRIAHELAGPAALVQRFAELPPQADWQRALAAALTEYPLGSPQPARVAFDSSAPGLSVRGEPLMSWIIAPRSAVTVTLPTA